MKNNFIQNLSEQVIKQNHQLKKHLQEYKLKFADYQNQMIKLIEIVVPNPKVLIDPQEVLEYFILQIKQQFQAYQEFKNKYEALQVQLYQIKNKNEQINQKMKQKQRQWTQNDINTTDQIQVLQAKTKAYESNIQQMKNEVKALKEALTLAKRQKLIFQQQKRAQIQQQRRRLYEQMTNFKDNNETDLLNKQMQFKRNLQQRDKVIGDMKRIIDQLQRKKQNKKQKQSMNQALASLNQSFNNYQALNKQNIQLKTQNSQHRQQIRKLYNQIMVTQSKIKELKTTIQNCLGNNQRLLLEKIQLQNQLLGLMKEINQSQIDKQAMQKYYDQKWNTQFKNVRLKLQKQHALKIIELQDNYNNRLYSYEVELKQATEIKEIHEKRNEVLEQIFQQKNSEIQSLKSTIQTLHDQLAQKQKAIENNFLKFKQQCKAIKQFCEHQKRQLNQVINKKSQQISQCKIQMLELSQEHRKHIISLQNDHAFRVKKIREQHTHSLSIRGEDHAKQIEIMMQLIAEQKDKHQKDIEKINEQNRMRIESINTAFDLQKKKMIQQNHDKQLKFKDRLIELQSLMSINKKKYESDTLGFRKFNFQLQQKCYDLRTTIEQRNESIKLEKFKKSQLQGQITKMQQNEIVLKQSIQDYEIKLQKLSREAQFLWKNRNTWKDQLATLERQYQTEFQALIKLHEQQNQINNNKIRFLEQVNRKNVATRKEYQKLKNIKTQKSQLEEQIHIKKAQNIILHQVKDYYECKLKEAEVKIGKNQFMQTHAILARKLKKNRIIPNEMISQRLNQSIQEDNPQKPYFIHPAKKKNNLSLIKFKYQDESKRRINSVFSFQK